MLGICPNCKIKLKTPPFGKRETNEMLLVLNYRKIIENKIQLKSIDELGYCELCDATKKELESQK